MPVDPRKRQKKQEKHAARRKTRQHEQSREKHAGLADRLAAAAGYPILHCWVSRDLWDQGLGWVCLSRELPNGSVAFGVFLVDRYCLGVKNAMADVVGRFTYDSKLVRKMRADYETEDLQPADARKLVEAAVAYAEALGFHSHADYHKAKLIFGAIDPGKSSRTFEFGKDGKPFFIAGPHDTPERSQYILRTLEAARGPGAYDFLVPIGGSTLVRELPNQEAVQELEPGDSDDNEGEDSSEPFSP